MITVVVVDGHPLYRTALRALLTNSTDVETIGEAGTIAEARDIVAMVRPDVTVIDAQLPDGSGVELCAEFAASYPAMPCLMLTTDHDPAVLVTAIAAGAAAFIVKTPRGDGIVRAVHAIASGEVIIGEALDPPPTPAPPRRRLPNGRQR